jgi:hypothetical protein
MGGTWMARAFRSLALAAVLGTAFMGLAACGGPERSVASYCRFLYGEGSKLRERWSHAASANDVFADLGVMFSALPELGQFMHELAERAPHEVAPSVELLAEDFKHEAASVGSQASNPLGAIAGGLVNGLEAVEPERRFNEFTAKNCGPPPGA